LENYNNGRGIGQKRTLESTNQCIGQSLTGIPWYGEQNLDQLERQFGNKIGCRSELDLKPKQLVPPEYDKYLDIFDEDKANQFPDTWPWDHKIEMKSGFEPKSFKTYNLTPKEQIELDKFLKENLDKEYIKPSQSPMASPSSLLRRRTESFHPAKIIDI
jgi:hypothetical protein